MNRDVIARGGEAVLVVRLAGGIDLDRERAGPFQILGGGATGREQAKKEKDRLTHRGRRR